MVWCSLIAKEVSDSNQEGILGGTREKICSTEIYNLVLSSQSNFVNIENVAKNRRRRGGNPEWGGVYPLNRGGVPQCPTSLRGRRKG